MRPTLLVVLPALLVAPALASAAGYRPGGPVPAACAGPAFTDAVGTPGVDLLAGALGQTQRLYGLTGDDWLAGSATNPTCLFGGQGDDVLALGAAGGVAFGEAGADLLAGSLGDDGLTGGDSQDVLTGAAGNDVLRGGGSVDALAGGDGDDVLDSADGRAEIVDCGPGADTALADAADVAVACEHGSRGGAPLRRKRLLRSTGGRQTIFRLRFVVPEAATAGGYRVLVAGACDAALREATAFPAPGRTVRGRAGRIARVGLRPPAGGWCSGAYRGAIVKAPPCPPGRSCVVARPVEPIAEIGFTVR